jgi:hypothetical protein
MPLQKERQTRRIRNFRHFPSLGIYRVIPLARLIGTPGSRFNPADRVAGIVVRPKPETRLIQ